MHICEKLRQSSSFAELSEIAQNAEPKISFWGCRYLVFNHPEYEGELHSDYQSHTGIVKASFGF